MERADNQPVMTNGYPIFEWYWGVTILDEDEYENEIDDVMEQLDYDMHIYPDDEDDKYNEDDKGTGEDD